LQSEVQKAEAQLKQLKEEAEKAKKKE
jgi:hypothetical protein